MDQELILENTRKFVENTLSTDSSGHDWWHIYRVVQNAKAISRHEAVDPFIVELAALLHDISDYKLNGGDIDKGALVAREWLEGQCVPAETIAQVVEIISDLSFKGAQAAAKPMHSNEGRVVQDADRLDAIGAIGIARTFAYGGHKGREIYNPTIPPIQHTSFEQYRANTAPTINHFYEKLLLLKDLMNTPTAQRIAEQRHTAMENFLAEFLREWDGKDLD
jgi:uncharacterized protein